MHTVYYKKTNKQNTSWEKIWGRYQISYRSLMVDFDVWYNASVDLLLYCWCSVALMLMLLHFLLFLFYIYLYNFILFLFYLYFIYICFIFCLYLDKTNKNLWSHQRKSHVWCSANTCESAAMLVINIWSWAVSLLHSWKKLRFSHRLLSETHKLMTAV